MLTFASGYFDVVLKRIRAAHAECWIITNSVGDRRALRLAFDHDCKMQSSDHYSDWASMFFAPRTLVMAASTFVYFPALLGSGQ